MRIIHGAADPGIWGRSAAMHFFELQGNIPSVKNLKESRKLNAS